MAFLITEHQLISIQSTAYFPKSSFLKSRDQGKYPFAISQSQRQEIIFNKKERYIDRYIDSRRKGGREERGRK